MKIITLICCFALFFLSSCQEETTSDSALLARAGEEKLYMSDLKGVIPAGSTSQDSSYIIQRYTDNWLKKHFFLSEAQASKSINLKEIDKKVEEYKNSLLIYEYQKEVINQRLDTLITDAELKLFYDQHAKDFELKQNIVKGILIRTKGRPQPLAWLAKEIIKTNNFEKSLKSINNYCAKSADRSNLNANTWQTFDVLTKGSIFSKIQNKTDWLTKHNWGLEEENGYIYFLMIYDFKLENRISPLEYVKEQIKSIILNSRKIKLLEEYEEELYKKALSEKQIEKF